MSQRKPTDSVRLRERDVTRQICEFMEWHGWRAMRNQVITSQNIAGGWIKAGEKGMPDWLFIHYFDLRPAAAVVLWVEVKAEGEGLRPDQVTWHQKELARGGFVVLADKFETFRDWYLETFEWLHKSVGQGQLDLEPSL